MHKQYDHSKSSTYVKNNTVFFIEYGDQTIAAGFVSKDTVRLGSVAIQNQLFAETLCESEKTNLIYFNNPTNKYN